LKRPDASTSAGDWNTGGGTLSKDNGEGRRVADGYALRSGLHSFSQFGLGLASTIAPLPVTLVSFRAVPQNGTVQVTWLVAQEFNVSAYVVERSLDGRSFATVGQVAARSGANLRYAFTDAPPAGSQRLYYRLRQVEANQADTFSPVVTVQLTAASAALTVWPTVFTTELHLDGSSLSEDLQLVELLDGLGRPVYRQGLPQGTRVATLTNLSLAPALYVLRLTTATGYYQQRVVAQ
jgi:hypothetical protein